MSTKYTDAKRDENGDIVSVCCEQELVMHPRCKFLQRRQRSPLAPAAITWICPGCNAVAMVDTELVVPS